MICLIKSILILQLELLLKGCDFKNHEGRWFRNKIERQEKGLTLMRRMRRAVDSLKLSSWQAWEQCCFQSRDASHYVLNLVVLVVRWRLRRCDSRRTVRRRRGRFRRRRRLWLIIHCADLCRSLWSIALVGFSEVNPGKCVSKVGFY